MLAAVWMGPGQLAIEQAPDPECSSGGVVIRVDACGVSGGDVRLFFEGGDGVVPPWTFGHEITGELVEVSPQAVAAGFALQPGTSVAAISTLTCGRCIHCRQGLEHVCQHGVRVGRQLKGGFAELVALPEMALRNIFAIPSGLDPVAATFADPLSDVICGHKDLDIGFAQTVVVIGGGPVGTAHAALARAQGASVRLHEALETRLRLCREVLGDEQITYVPVASEDPVESVLAATGGLGADRVIVATAAVSAQEQGVAMAAPRGRVLFFSDLPPGVEHIRFPVNHQYAREIAVLGSYGSRYADQIGALEMLARNTGNVRAVVSDVVGLAELPEACRRIRAGEVLKVVVRPRR